MRYIGNKTKLLGFIGSVIDALGVTRGRAADAFAGTASAAQYLKRRGFTVESCDIMSYSYALQRACVQLDALPDFRPLLASDAEVASVCRRTDFQATVASRFGSQRDLFGHGPDLSELGQILVFLDSFLEPLSTFITREYSALQSGESPEARMFFTESNGRRIDAIRTRLHDWLRAETLTPDAFFLLLTCLIEGADSVANTTGVYAAFVKTWQSNAVKPLRLRLPDIVTDTGLACRAHQGDANLFVRDLPPVDLLYLDPPYNTRQYSSYYHVPEVIAEGWFGGEPAVRGKTGLIPDEHKKSNWSIQGECEAAFRDLIAHSEARYVLLSYNNEGIIPTETVDDVFREFGREGTLRTFTRDYSRYRSDRDHDQRVYKGDVVTEYVYAVELDRAAARLRPAGTRAAG